jgi:hypothetical protein
MITRSLRFVALSLALLPAACGSSAQSGPTCQAGQFKLVGTLDGQPVDVTASSEGSGLTQVGSGELDVGPDPDPSAPARPQLSLTWPQGVADGVTTAASGTLIPADGPRAGQTLCVGSGTTVTLGDGVQMQLKGFASGSNCETPVTGELTGCWQ